jgi:tetratricopeptide (TPR) repeat protein
MPALPAISGPSVRQALVAFALAGLAAYFNSFQGAFVFDDNGMIVDPDIGKPLAGRLAGRPVVSLTFTLNYWLDGFNTRGYHLANLTIHVLAALTLFDLLRRTLVLPRFGDRYANSAGWLAFAVALLWLVHPLNTQSVTYLVQRCESLMGMLVLVSFWCYLRGYQSGDGRWYWLAGLACVLASGCKELTLAVPVLAALYDRLFLAGSWRETLTRWKPLAILTIGPALGIALLLARGVLGDAGGTVGFAIPRYTPITYALTQTEVIPHYLYLSVWPKDLCLDYIDWPVRKNLGEVWPFALGLAVGLALSVLGLLRNRSWAFLPAWFFVILAPTSSIVPIQDPAFEHRMYLSLIAVVLGLALWVETILGAVPGRAKAILAALLVAGLLVALTGRTILRNEDYSSESKLVATTLAIRPDNARSRVVYAGYLLRIGLAKEALEQVRKALERSELVGDFTILANCHQELGQSAEAELVLKSLLESRPNDGKRNYAYALLLLQNGKPVEAEPYIRTAMQTINDIRTRLLLAVILEEQGKAGDAEAVYAQTRPLTPEGFRHALATSARRTALNPEATPFRLRQAYLDALGAVRLNSNRDWEEWDTFAIVLARLGKYAEAVAAGEKALAAAPGEYERAWLGRRLELFRAGKPYLQPGATP